MTLESTLRTHTFTQGLADRHIAELAALATEVAFPEDQVIFEDGDESRYFYLVVSGSVTVELHASSFKVCILAVGPGQAFGWSALLDRQPTVFRVRARESTVALRIAGKALHAACLQDPTLGVEILMRALQLAAGRIQATEARFAEMCGVRVDPPGRRPPQPTNIITIKGEHSL